MRGRKENFRRFPYNIFFSVVSWLGLTTLTQEEEERKMRTRHNFVQSTSPQEFVRRETKNDIIVPTLLLLHSLLTRTIGLVTQNHSDDRISHSLFLSFGCLVAFLFWEREAFGFEWNMGKAWILHLFLILYCCFHRAEELNQTKKRESWLWWFFYNSQGESQQHIASSNLEAHIYKHALSFWLSTYLYMYM